MMETKKVHFNKPQLLTNIIKPHVGVNIWGRGTGKGTGSQAPFSLENTLAMPRGNGMFLGKSYEQILKNTLPGIISGWERMGYIENVHFFVRRYAPNKYKWPKAYWHPVKADHYIHWINGSGIYLVSQDRPGMSNGLNVDWIAVDEAKFINYKRLQEETIPTIRGNAQEFGKSFYHGRQLYTTDMPDNSKSNWLFEFEDKMDSEVIDMIFKLEMKVMELRRILLKDNSQSKVSRINTEINKLNRYLNELRKGSVFVSYASTLDNIHALGIDVIKNYKRTLTDLNFRTSVLNHRISQIQNGFYGTFDEDVFGYTASNYSFIDHVPLNSKKDCRWDGDLIMNSPLHISADYNSAINCMVIGQNVGKEFRIINAMHVKGDLKLKDLAQSFCDYYRFKTDKVVHYYYDNTAIGTNASTNISYADEWISILRDNGWTVINHYLKQSSSHHSRFYLWGLTFAKDDRLSKFRINTTNCRDLITSICNAPIKKSSSSRGEAFKKDKSSELDGNTLPEHATHYSEALDHLWWGTQRHKLNKKPEFFDIKIN